jgi:ribose transport system permease protein
MRANTRTTDNNHLLSWFYSNSIVVIIILILIALSVVDRNFLTLQNFINITNQYSALAIVSVGITFSIISRNIDLSPGSLIALSGIVFGLVYLWTGSILLSIVCCIATSILVELFNGFLISKFNINPVIVTLAAMIWARGLSYGLTENNILIRHPFIDFMNTKSLLFVTPMMGLLLVSFFIGWFFLKKTRLGKYTYALGGDEEAVKRAGINIFKYKMLIFLFVGSLIGIASVITVSRLGSAQVNAGYGLELLAIASVIVGGNSLSGGKGGLLRTIYGIVFLALVQHGLRNIGFSESRIYFFTGLILIIAISIETVLKRRKELFAS